MKINDVFDDLFKAFPKARESKSMARKPKADLDWKPLSISSYYAVGSRGGILTLNYTQSSNKITISYGQASRTGLAASMAAHSRSKRGK